MTRTKISVSNPQQKERRMQSYSMRDQLDKISVIRKLCPHCHHHKAIVNQTFTKCARCKRRII